MAIRIPGLLKKLDERFRGPYFVVKRTPHQNYIVKNKMGKQLSSSFPLSKLKIIKDWAAFDLTIDDDVGNHNCQIIDRILNERTRNGVTEYLIKWNGYTSDYNSWLAEKDIIDKKKLINYRSKGHTTSSITNWEEATSVNSIQVAKHRVVNSGRLSMKLLGWFRWLLLWLFVITVANSTLTLNDSFRYCTQNSANI